MNVGRWSDKQRVRRMLVPKLERALDQESIDSLVDAVLDREIEGADRERIESLIRQNREASQQLDQTQAALDAVRSPVRAPDLTASILDEVGRRRGWLDRPALRLVTVGRMAMAASFLLLVTAAFVTERVAPEAVRFSETPAPVTQLLETGHAEATNSLRNVARVFDSLKSPKPQACDQGKSSGTVTFCNKGDGKLTFTGNAIVFVSEGAGHARSVVRLNRSGLEGCDSQSGLKAGIDDVICLKRLDGGMEFVRRTGREDATVRFASLPMIPASGSGQLVVNFERRSGGEKEPTAVFLKIERDGRAGESTTSAREREDAGDGVK